MSVATGLGRVVGSRSVVQGVLGRKAKSRSPFGWLVGLGLVLASGAGGCGTRLERVARREGNDAVLRVVKDRRRPLRAREAMVVAKALEADSRPDEARAVLVAGFERSGDTAVLVALAELEARHGWNGTAALHYQRVQTLDAQRLRGNTQACELFLRRAETWADTGEVLAAWNDANRVAASCPTFDPAGVSRLREAIRGPARAQMAAIRRLADCVGACLERSLEEEDQTYRKGLAEARMQGVDALVAWAQREEVELPPADVLAVLAAEIDGRLGPDLLGDEVVRRLVGNQVYLDLAIELTRLPPAAAAYARLRLERVLPPGVVQDDTERSKLVAQVLEPSEASVAGGGLQGWRVLALLGDPEGAELLLGARLRASDGSGTARETVFAFVSTPHWTTRAPIDPATLPALVLAARLPMVRGQVERALELRAGVFLRAERLGTGDVTREVAELVRSEARRELVLGRPRYALVLADVLSTSALEDLRGVAAAGVLLEAWLCAAGGCRGEEVVTEAPEEGADGVEQAIRAVLGRSTTAERLESLAFARAAGVPPRPPGCPDPAEWLAEDAKTPLAVAMRGALRDPASPETIAGLGRALESDLTLRCAAEVVLPAMMRGAHRATAARLLDLFRVGGELETAGQEATLGGLALLAGNVRLAESAFIQAAARSSDPSAQWGRSLALFSGRLPPELARLGLRERFLHGSGQVRQEARWSMVRASLDEAPHAFDVKATATGPDALRRLVEAYVREGSAQRAWSRLERVGWLRAESRRGSGTAGRREVVADATDAPGFPWQRHPHLAASFAGNAASKGEGDKDLRSLDADRFRVQAAFAGDATVPGLAAAVLPVASLAPVAAFSTKAQPGPRSRAEVAALIGAILTGDERVRRRALSILAESLAGSSGATEALMRWLSAGPSAFDPVAGLVPVLSDASDLAWIGLGLPLDPGPAWR